MKRLELLSKQCVSICQVPVDFPRDYLLHHVKSQFQAGKILDSDQVDGIESGKHLTRIVVLCSSLEGILFSNMNI